jgi:hypothetical protein
MNKLSKNILITNDWGSEVIWATTDNYIAKTIDIKPNSKSPIFLSAKRDKNIIVINGEFYLVFGNCCDEDPLKTYKLPEGWSWYIGPRHLYRYMTLNKSARIIEVSTYLDDMDQFIFNDDDIKNNNKSTVIEKLNIVDDGFINIGRPKNLINDLNDSELPKRKRGRPKGSKNKK